MRTARAIAVAALLLLSACSSRSAPAPPVPPLPADATLHVTLAWSAPVDLDLYVTDPAAETLYFAHNPTRAGARLAADMRCAAHDSGLPALEEATFAPAAPGRYRVGVDFMDPCLSTLSTVPFRIAVDLAGARRAAEGSVARGQFAVIVLEFEVGEDGHLK